MDSIGIHNKYCVSLTQLGFVTEVFWCHFGVLGTLINHFNFHVSFKIIFCAISYKSNLKNVNIADDSKLATFYTCLQIFMVPNSTND